MQNFTKFIQEWESAHSTAGLHACTDEELHQGLADILAHSRGEALTDGELQQFWAIYQEIQRRRQRCEAAA